ncbi:hypothetical protein ACXYMO_11435 [Arenibacterium sp. CAU 1754]
MLKKVIAVFSACLLLAACETETVEQIVPAQISTGKARLVLYRTGQFAGSANLYTVSVNGSPITHMGINTKRVADVPAGPVQIRAETYVHLFNVGLMTALQAKPEITLNTNSGATYYIRVSARDWDASPVLTNVPTSTGAAESANLSSAMTP